MNGCGHNIPLVINARSGFYEKQFSKINTTQICANPPSLGIARQSTWKKAWYSQNLTKSREVSQTSGRQRLRYSSDEKYQIRVVQDYIFQKSIQHTFLQITQLLQSEAIHTVDRLVQSEFEKGKKQGRPSNSQGQNIPLVIDTRSGL